MRAGRLRAIRFRFGFPADTIFDMTAGITPVSAPHGKGFYVTVAIFASLFAFLWGACAKG